MEYEILFAITIVIVYKWFQPSKPISVPTPIPRDNIVTFYFQGNNASRAQASKYTGGTPVTYTVNDEEYMARCDRAPLLLHNIYKHPELHDVGYGSYNPCHWLFQTITYFQNRSQGIQAPSHCFYITRWNVGGNADLEHYLIHFREMLNRMPFHKKIVVYGPSRGASLTLVAVSQLTPEEQARIALVIVEAPFDTFPNVLNAWPYLRYVAGIQLYLISRFGLYEPSQLTPLDAITQISHKIPIAFITSECDTVVPKTCTQNLIDRLHESGHPLIHHCELQRSSHDGMSLEDKEDQQMYFDFMNALYDRYC
jgi:hypothetical protein